MSHGMIALIGWSDVEISTGIICACLPTLRPIITRISKARARLCSRIHGKKTTGKHDSNSTSNNSSSSSSNRSGTATIPSVCQHSLSNGSDGGKACHVCNTTAVNRQSSHDRLYYGADHDLYSILSMDDELSLEHTGDMSMSIMPFKHEFGEHVGTGV
jgi:DnaJ-class molecular chaperone